MKRYLLSLALPAFVAAAVACNENTAYQLNVPPTIDVTSGADIAFKAIGGEGTIEVAPVDGSLQVTTSQSDWCHLTVSGNRISVQVDPYDGLESRYAVLDMQAGKATGKTIVHQYGVIVKEYSWTDVTVKNQSRDLVFPYDADGTTVKVTSDEDWLTFDVTPETLTIHVAENPSIDYREAHVHWSVGKSVSGNFTIGQFDLEAAGLLGDWTWHGKQSPNNRDFPMQAVLAEAENGTYTLALSYSAATAKIDIKIDGVTLQANKLMLPLGHYVGTYTVTRNNTVTVHHAFPIVAEGLARLYFYQAVTTGSVPFVLERNDNDQWLAGCDLSAYPDMLFRFEMWSTPEDIEDSLSSSGLILSDVYMGK